MPRAFPPWAPQPEPVPTVSGVPTSANTKAEIVDWLTKVGVDVPSSATKSELLDLVAEQ